MTDDAIQWLIGDTDTATSKVTLSNSVYTARKKILLLGKLKILLNSLPKVVHEIFLYKRKGEIEKILSLQYFLHKFFLTVPCSVSGSGIAVSPIYRYDEFPPPLTVRKHLTVY
jgi:hypothetical protein